MMLKKDLIHQTLNAIDHYLQEKIKKVKGLTKDELEGKIMTEFGALRPKSHSYLLDDSGTHVIKRSKRNKEMCNEKIFKFNDYKHCFLKKK